MVELPLPTSPQAEAALVGLCLIDPTVAPNFTWMDAKMFSNPMYRLFWEGIAQCQAQGRSTDCVTISDEIDRMGKDADHYAADLSQLMAAAYDLANPIPQDHAAIIVEKYQLRKMIHVSKTLAASAYKQVSPMQVCGEIIRRLSSIMEEAPGTKAARVTFSQLMTLLDDETERRKANEHIIIKSGFSALDAAVGGFEGGEYILVAARPGAGKSAWATSLATQLGARFHRYNLGCVAFFSMEMTIIAQARRIIASVAEPAIETKMMRAGFREGDRVDEEAYVQFINHIGEREKTIGDALVFYEGAMTTDMFAMRVMEEVTLHGTRVFIIDQLDHFLDKSRDGNPTTRIEEISRKLKHIAVRYGVIIICLAQFNRNMTDRTDKRPQLTDLKQSGNLEQDADIVLGLYRPWYFYNSPDDPQEYTEWAELGILKNRDAQLGMVPLCFRGKQVSFRDWDAERYPTAYMQELVSRKEKGK